MNILVTGAAGFIGSHLVDKLLKDGHTVFGVDISHSRDNLIHAIASNRFFKAQVDIGNSSEIESVFCDRKIDYVFHLAALGSVPRSFAHPEDYINTNVKGTLNVLNLALRHRIKKFIFISSSSIYGMRSPYAMSKKSGEDLCEVYHKAHHLPITILRYFNVFGPRQNSNSEYSAVVPKFIRCFLENKRPTIYGNGDQSRDFTYIKDVVNITAKIGLEDMFASIDFRNHVYDVAFQNPLSIDFLCSSIAKTMQFEHHPKYEAARVGDILHSRTQHSVIKNRFDQTPLSDALLETIQWYKGHQE